MTGVVPRREWGEAKTLVTEGLEQGKAADVSTNDHVSPWAPTNVAHETSDLGRETDSPAAAGPIPRARFQSSRGLELPTTTSNPEEVLRSQARAPENPLETSPGEQTSPASPPQKSRVPLYIALLSAIVALLAGLIWLVSQP